jgi:hypothetical protein
MGRFLEVDDVERRWEAGIEHHPFSVKLMAHMKKMDVSNSADLRTGGDGDLGETLMYLMDSFFEKFEKDFPALKLADTK